MSKLKEVFQSLDNGKNTQTSNGIKIYGRSYSELNGTKVVMIKENNKKYLLATGDGELFNALKGEVEDGCKLAPVTHENRLVLNKYFDYTVPKAFGTQIATIGLGDRLGIASPGHIKTVEGKDVRPILAQQSIRELNMTGRTYHDVLDAASYAVFQEGYKDGFGADGDHLKVESDIQMSLDLGFTMITLDCSEKIDNTIDGSSTAEREAKYAALPEAVRKHYEDRYLDKSFEVGGTSIRYDKATLIENVLIYGEAVNFVEHVYHTYIQKAGRPVDFEISIDETETPTAPESHFFVAKELYSRGLEIYSMAPRFIGEFQKGIDYVGDLEQFEKELKIHAAIADDFGYKLSIHSGSDKFSVFSMIGKYTKGRFHVKTAGTNWLEAVRTVAKVNPDLYRRIHQFALDNFDEAKKFYHVSTDLSKVPALDQVSDQDLNDAYMNEDNGRQLLHITYGLILQAKDDQGKSLFKDEFFRTLSEQEDAYEESLIAHIGKHLQLLGK